MKIAIIQFPGTNCESESIRAVRQAGMEAKEFFWNEDPKKLESFDGYFIIGGFSYEDRSRAGIISALDPLMPHIKAESEKGKPVLGICNGAQVLVETGLVPGLTHDTVGMALAVNKRVKNDKVLGTGFYNTWVNMQLTAPSGSCAFTRNLKEGDFIHVPIAHGEGRFIIPEGLLDEMKVNNLDVFRYCDDGGKQHDEFPINPNGSVESLAAVCNTGGNIMAMMPHPERTENGNTIFTSMHDYIAEEKKVDLTPLSFKPADYKPKNYKPTGSEMLVDLIITDNEASTVENTLQQIEIHANIKRMNHWEISIDSTDLDKDSTDKKDLINKIIKSGELLNTNKETVTELTNIDDAKTVLLLVRYRDDFVGQSKTDTLKNHFGLDEIIDIKKGTLWQITIERGNIEEVVKHILDSHILFNQYSQECFIYNINMDNKDKIKNNLENCLTETNLSLPGKKIGKVRDSYDLEDKMLLITTDRQSAFDRILASIPFKGQVLNQTSAWWFEQTKHIIDNHVIDVPDPNVTVGKKCTVFSVEFVVRGYITGTTDTSAWMNYKEGVREFCGNTLPEGLVKNQKFETPIVTPTTKADDHDESISPAEIVSRGLMSQEDWDFVSGKALELFKFGQETAAKNGLILVDTKYEFGKDADGNILLIDEIHTPDSSRYWIAESYEERMTEAQEPENIDKEFLRLWFRDNCDPYNDETLPPAPDDLVIELSRRYIMLYEMITGEKFEFPEGDINERLKRNLESVK